MMASRPLNVLLRAARWGAAATAVVAATAAPAFAWKADPSRSMVWVQAPVLAPGASGKAPIYGEIDPGGSFVLRSSAAQLHTGNPLHDSILHQAFPGSVVLEAWSPVAKLRGTRRAQATGLLHLRGAVTRVPLVVRTMVRPDGVYMQTYCHVPLAPWGVRTLSGGAPGDVRVAINAFFPRR